VLIGFYLIVAAALAVPIGVFLYFKMLINEAYCGFNQKRPAFKGVGVLTFLFTLMVGFPVILLSLVVDVLALPDLLMRDEKDFEYKYKDLDQMRGMDKVTLTSQFLTLFIHTHYKRQGKSMTKEQLRVLKTKQYSIVDNFHSFFCRGDKNYRASMANIHVFNLTKALNNQMSVPNNQGKHSEDALHFDLGNAIYHDLILFNFFHYVLEAGKEGHDLSHSELVLYGYP